MNTFILGSQVQDIISGVRGIVTARTEFINGCVQYTMSPKAKANASDIPESYMIDADQLKEVGAGIRKTKKKKTADVGGPTTRVRARSRASSVR